MKRVKFQGGILDGGYCWVTENMVEDDNGFLVFTLPNTVYCGKRYGRDIVYNKQVVNGEIKYVWNNER